MTLLKIGHSCPIFLLGLKTYVQVKVDHMAIALSRTFKSGIVDIIQSLPQHQQVGIIMFVYLVLLQGSNQGSYI